jgi:SAM-dependent methyltransferase
MEQDKIWEAFQNDESLVGSFAPEKRLEVIAKYIPQGSRVLNIGVGNGYLEKLLDEKGAVVYCLDPSTRSIERIREQLELGERAKIGYSQSIPFSDGLFDFVVMSEVLEHLDDAVLAETLIDVRRVLHDDGHFLGTVPADENLQEGIVVCPGCSERIHRWGHVQSFAQARLFQLFSAHFKDIQIHRRSFVDLPRLNWKGRIVGSLKALQASLGFKGGNQNFIFDASSK